MAIIGYARVSTTDQDPQLQLDALQQAGAARIFTDHGVSGSKASRPQLDACLDHLRHGDVLTVWKLDRLGRNTQYVLAVVEQLTSRGIGFRSLTEGLHTDGPMGKAMLTIMAAFAQLERDTMIERTRAGLAAAAANGRKGGRPRRVDDADAAKARTMRDKGITATDIAKMLGVSRATVYRYLAQDAVAVDCPDVDLEVRDERYLPPRFGRRGGCVDRAGEVRRPGRTETVADRDQIAMFLDCSKSCDATGLVACRLEDMYVFLPFGDSVWERPHGWAKSKQWLAPREEVDAKVRAALHKWDVAWLGIDPSPAVDDSTEALYWASMIAALHRDFRNRLPLWATPGDLRGNSVMFDMRTSQPGAQRRNQQFSPAAEMVAQWVDEEGVNGPLRHDGHPHLRTHTHNARRRPNHWGVSLGKVSRDSTKHVDLAVCMVGAVMGARVALNSGKLPKKRTGKAFFV